MTDAPMAGTGNGGFRTTLQCRHTDLDVQKLINNVAIAEMFEEARTQYSVSRRLKPHFDPHRRFLERISIDFGSDAKYPGGIDFNIGVLEIRPDGWTLRIIATQRGEFVARCDTRFALQSEGRPVALPDGLAEILRGDLICT